MLSLSPLHHGNSSYAALSLTALIGLVTLTFDFLTSTYVHSLLVRCASIVLIWGFLSLSVVKLGRATRSTDKQMDGPTDTGRHFIMSPFYEGRGLGA